MSPNTPADTLPLAGRVGEGGAPRSNLARKLRATPTPAEVRLWRILHPFRTDGYHFRKQARIGSYVVDFACLHAGIVIEVDGDTHGNRRAIANDAIRDDHLRGRGFAVLRFTNDDVMTNENGVYVMIAEVLRDRPRNHRVAPPSPTLPARGRVSESQVLDASHTSPLVGEDGRGRAPRSNPGGGRL